MTLTTVNNDTIIMINVCFIAALLSEVIMMIDWSIMVFMPLMMEFVLVQRMCKHIKDSLVLKDVGIERNFK